MASLEKYAPLPPRRAEERREEMTKQETIDLLAKRFPKADPEQIRRYVETGWDGDTPPDDFEIMAEAWLQALEGPDGPATN
jgi:hypothetical protein